MNQGVKSGGCASKKGSPLSHLRRGEARCAGDVCQSRSFESIMLIESENMRKHGDHLKAPCHCVELYSDFFNHFEFRSVSVEANQRAASSEWKFSAR